jgi:hypothetical protein
MDCIQGLVPQIDEIYDRYPSMTVLLSNLSTATIWLAGTYVIWMALGAIAAFAFIVYLLVLEVNLLRKSCVNCHYYGRVCFSGRGRVCAGLLRRGDNVRFASREISWKNVLPDLAVSLVPIALGIGLMLFEFSWTILISVIALLALSTVGSGLIRGRLACKHCRQRLLGCPAERLFSKKVSEEQ